MADLYYDPYDVEIDADPYPVSRRLRDEAPLYYNDVHDFFAVSRFDDVERGLVDKATFSSARGGILELIKSGIEIPPGTLLFEDPPVHTIHRALLSRVFTPKKMLALEPQIREFCAQSLDPLVGADRFDMIADFGAVRVGGALHDRRSGARFGVRPTGHGRRASFLDPVLPRMGCTYIAAGSLAPAEVIASVGRGIYIRRMEAASVDRRSGRAVFRVTDSDLIVSGELAGPLLPYMCVVDGPRVLADLRLVADDLAFDTRIGRCHRDGQALAIGVGAPTICIGVSAISPSHRH